MTSDASEGLKIPTRPAPPPPKIGDSTNGLARRNTTFVASEMTRPSNISSRAERFTYQSVPRSRSTSDISGGRRKPAPPRPPPPKLPPITAETNVHPKHQSIKIKLPGFKSRKKYQQNNKPHVHVWRAPSNKSHPLVGSLIDLQSPPKSPFIDNGSSSDDSSVDSFDSDSGGPSSTDNQNDFSNGWNGSQVESGFEDDFDRISTPSSSDPWSDSKADPFSPQRRIAPSHSMEGSGNSNNKFDISNDDPKSKKHILSSPSIFKPTVIRPSIPIFESKSGYSSSFKNDDDSIDGSPPMPSIPPPPPPPEVLEVLAHGPPIPPRPAKSYDPSKKGAEKPYCIALYDYVGDVAEDLCFKENDTIILKRRVNEEWLEGEVNGKTGIFPVCFVDIKVSLNGNNDTDFNKIAITLFDYRAQTWDDLDIKEGDLIRVIGEVDENWLYGECNGKQGQFPKNYTAEYLLN
ncbi:hypothetical protein V9T40_013102 [Parthenolecanium corni]|uniref:SH3 domain-containing protein n=1 Tax=Parthenolecanium corni TaxID=536013 RepID=A0AAN9TJ87_9HEMI